MRSLINLFSKTVILMNWEQDSRRSDGLKEDMETYWRLQRLSWSFWTQNAEEIKNSQEETSWIEELN